MHNSHVTIIRWKREKETTNQMWNLGLNFKINIFSKQDNPIDKIDPLNNSAIHNNKQNKTKKKKKIYLLRHFMLQHINI